MNKNTKELTPEGGWQAQSPPRLEPIPKNRLGFFERRLVDKMMLLPTAHCPNLYQTMLRNSRVFRAFLRFSVTLMPRGELSRRQTELAILRVGWKTRCRYEWAQHCDIGSRAGLTVQEIQRVAQGPNADGWQKCDAAILAAVDELVDGHMISDAVWQELSSHLNENLLIELIMLIGGYTALAGALNSVGVELEPELENVVVRVESPK